MIVAGIFDQITQTINNLFAMVKGTASALSQTFTQISTFNDTIQGMIDNMANGTSNTGVPVTEAIGTIRYCIGDTLFFTIYLIILFGVLFTLVKLANIVMRQIIKIGEVFTSIGGRQGIIDKIKTLFTGFN